MTGAVQVGNWEPAVAIGVEGATDAIDDDYARDTGESVAVIFFRILTALF